MKHDQIYLHGLLKAFEASSNPTTDIKKLKGFGYDHEEETGIFLLSIEMLYDEGFITRNQGYGIGYKTGADNIGSWSVVQLKITSKGRFFLENLENR